MHKTEVLCLHCYNDKAPDHRLVRGSVNVLD